MSLTISNPSFVGLPLKTKLLSSSKPSFSFAPPSSSSFSLRLDSIHRRRISLLVSGAALFSPKGLSGLSSPIRNRQVAFAASHEESSSEADMEENDVNKAGEGSQEAWEKVLASFKEQALKLQSVSQEAYEVYMKKAVVTLNDTAEKLKIQADQARQDLSVLTEELGEEGRQYITAAAENSPEPVKDVVETFASARDLDDVSKVRDFYIGIPYGAILSVGGFVNFMVTGSLSAVRFGVILGGILLALSYLSLRSWRKGQFSNATLKGQAAITSILFLRDARLVFEGLTFAGLIKTIISGGVAAFFLYRTFNDKRQRNVDGEATI